MIASGSPVASPLPPGTTILLGALLLVSLLAALGGSGASVAAAYASAAESTAPSFAAERAAAWGLFSVALVPGETLVGGARVWTLVTAAFAEPAPARLAAHAALVAFLGARSELPAGRHTQSRVLRTALLAALLAGLVAAAGRLAAFMSSGREALLYAPLFGSGPLVGALAVLAFEVHGDAHVVSMGAPAAPGGAAGAGAGAGAAPAAVPFLRYSALPLLVVLGAAAAQFWWLVATDAAATAVAVLVSWTYLRLFCHHGDGLVGDARAEFEFLQMFPGPLRVALRPLEKAGSATLRPLLVQLAALVAGAPAARAAAGAGAAAAGAQQQLLPLVAPAGAAAQSSSVGAPGSSIYGQAADAPGAGGYTFDTFGSAAAAAAAAAQRIDLHVHLNGSGAGGAAGGGVTADPVAERRREKALRALDKRLADLKSKIRDGGSALSQPQLPQISGSTAP